MSQIVLNKQKKNDELSDDFDFNLENTEIYTGYLDEERIQQEIEILFEASVESWLKPLD